jgi:hypothetical protein
VIEMTEPTSEPAETPIDHDSPLWGEDPVDDTPDDGVEPTGTPPEDWDQTAHSDAYEADPAVDTSPVGDEG